VPNASTTVTVRKSPERGLHDIYFNSGAAGSQAHFRRFGDVRPDQAPNREASTWLSRGLNEALEKYINSCDPALRIER
jgi:hypothetical protein